MHKYTQAVFSAASLVSEPVPAPVTLGTAHIHTIMRAHVMSLIVALLCHKNWPYVRSCLHGREICVRPICKQIFCSLHRPLHNYYLILLYYYLNYYLLTRFVAHFSTLMSSQFTNLKERKQRKQISGSRTLIFNVNTSAGSS